MAIMKTAYNKATKKRISYHTLSPQLKTGDLVLFAGTSWSSRIVQLFTFSQWSHIGVVVRLPQYDNQPLLWELTRASKLADIKHGVLADGLQLVPLADKIKTYAGQVAIRRLKHGGDEATRLAHLQHLLAVWQAKPYCNIVKKNLQAWWRGEQACTIGLSGGFCSEFVAELYKQWQLLPHDKPSRYYLPDDFARSSSLKLLRGQLSPAWLLTV